MATWEAARDLVCSSPVSALAGLLVGVSACTALWGEDFSRLFHSIFPWKYMHCSGHVESRHSQCRCKIDVYREREKQSPLSKRRFHTMVEDKLPSKISSKASVTCSSLSNFLNTCQFLIMYSCDCLINFILLIYINTTYTSSFQPLKIDVKNISF